MFGFGLFSTHIPYIIVAILYSLFFITWSLGKVFSEQGQEQEPEPEIRIEIRAERSSADTPRLFEKFSSSRYNSYIKSKYLEYQPFIFKEQQPYITGTLIFECLKRCGINFFPNPPPDSLS